MRRTLITLALPLALLAPATALQAAEPAPIATTANAALPFKQPREGLYTHGQPSAEQLAQARAAGVTTVIDLRGEKEARGYDEAATAQSLGLRYLSLPVAGGTGVTMEAARQLHELLASNDGPVLLHCASGNRVGALLALAAAHVDGADRDTALAFGRAAGLGSLLPVVEKQMPATAAVTAGQNVERP